MSEGTLPEWLTEEDDGSVTVSFKDMKRKPEIDGTEVSELRMREPSVMDQLSQEKKHRNKGDAEIALIANLTEQSPDAIQGLKMKQYNRCAVALAFFQSD
ncbi:phage tail assembly protein [uncultured Tateyamaria sp.]|uniref:phage tail assembly protein n=1 Tax=uncultured Tateyamaria sp. TaxID=455651 RepID=UPI002634C577|nr:phage tail assembly protein [uncultured Tateyamaria sp.]